MNKKTPVVILCGGMGTRIREETEYKPKPLIEIGGKPILWHIMKIYATQGFTNFILCLGYKGEMIKNYFQNYEILNNDFTVELGNQKPVEIHKTNDTTPWKITLVDTGKTALKGARVAKIKKYVNEDEFMLTYGDGVADINLSKLLAFHKEHGQIGTVTGVRPPSRFGELLVKDQQVTSFTEKPQVSEGMINGGFFVFNKKLFDYLSDEDTQDFEKGPLEKLAKEKQLSAYKLNGDWACMDTFRDSEYLNNLWGAGNAFWKTWD